MSIIELIGWLGGWLLAICGAPQAYLSWKNKNSEGVSSGFLGLWLGGELCMIAYVLPKEDAPILFNLFSNVLFISIIVYFKLWPGGIKWANMMSRLKQLLK